MLELPNNNRQAQKEAKKQIEGDFAAFKGN